MALPFLSCISRTYFNLEWSFKEPRRCQLWSRWLTHPQSSLKTLASWSAFELWTCTHLDQSSSRHSRSSLFEVSSRLCQFRSLGSSPLAYHSWNMLDDTTLEETHARIKEHWFSSTLKFRSTSSSNLLTLLDPTRISFMNLTEQFSSLGR